MSKIDFHSNRFDYSENGMSFTATKNSTTDHDHKLTKELFLTGGEILYKDANWGDYIEAQVVDVDNILGYGAGTVIKHYIKKKYVHPDVKCVKLETPYAGKVLKDLYLRIKYHSTGTSTDVSAAVNYELHEEV